MFFKSHHELKNLADVGSVTEAVGPLAGLGMQDHE
jgi:hypothetical protein